MYNEDVINSRNLNIKIIGEIEFFIVVSILIIRFVKRISYLLIFMFLYFINNFFICKFDFKFNFLFIVYILMDYFKRRWVICEIWGNINIFCNISF